MTSEFFAQLDAQSWGNLIQVVLIVVSVSGISAALRNGAKDRKTALALARADRQAADDRAEEDRRQAAVRAESDRQHAREQVQQQFRVQQGLRLMQLMHAGRPDNPAEQNAWSVETRTLLHALGQADLPVSWAEFTDSNGGQSIGSAGAKQEVADYVERAARELNCASCFHNH